MAQNIKVYILVLMTALTVSACAAPFPAPPELSSQTAAPYEYTIGAGDQLNIFVWGYEDLSDNVPVRPDGQITTRLVEDLQASGKTPTELAREIERQYTKFVKKPVVTVSVDRFIGTRSQQVKIIGASAEPRTIPFTPRLTLLDLVIEIGGLGEFANGNRAVLLRESRGETQKYSLRLDDLIRKGDLTANTQILPGDVIIVPQSWF